MASGNQEIKLGYGAQAEGGRGEKERLFSPSEGDEDPSEGDEDR